MNKYTLDVFSSYLSTSNCGSFKYSSPWWKDMYEIGRIRDIDDKSF